MFIHFCINYSVIYLNNSRSQNSSIIIVYKNLISILHLIVVVANVYCCTVEFSKRLCLSLLYFLAVIFALVQTTVAVAVVVVTLRVLAFDILQPICTSPYLSILITMLQDMLMLRSICCHVFWTYYKEAFLYIIRKTTTFKSSPIIVLYSTERDERMWNTSLLLMWSNDCLLYTSRCV